MKAELDWSAEDVMRAVHGRCLHEQTWRATGISIDSRTTKAGDLFIALKGPTHDGHEHIASALSAGAVAAIVATQPTQVAPDTPLIMVDDTFTALQDIGKAGRIRAEGSIAAVTGSVGKTGTKEMLRIMLAANGATYANEGSLNNHWGVPLSLARLPQKSRFGVFEVGMNHPGELGPLSLQVQPHVALVTTVEAVHLQFFADIGAIADAKAEIFEGVLAQGSVVLNRDNGQFGRLATAAKARGLKRILSFGRDSKTDARLLSWQPESEGSRIASEILGKKHEYYLSAPGEHLILNSLGALLTAVTIGADLDAAAAALAHYRSPKGRGVIQTIEIPTGSITLIDESYNASPVAVQSAIRVLGEMRPGSGGRRVLVLGDMRELGDASRTLHEGLAEQIAASHIDKVHCCGELMQSLYRALPPDVKGIYAQSSVELMPKLSTAFQNGDIVTVKGSLSTRMQIIVDAIRQLSDLPKERTASKATDI